MQAMRAWRVMGVLAALAATAAGQTTTWSDYVNEDTFLVVRVDLAAADVDALIAEAKALLPAEVLADGSFEESMRGEVAPWLEAFDKAGGRELLLVMGTRDLVTNPEPTIIAPLRPGANVEHLSALLVSGKIDGPTSQGGLAAERIGDAVIVAAPARLRTWAQFEATERPDLAAALEAVQGHDVQAAAALPTYAARIFAALAEGEQLPPPYEDVSVDELFGSVKWVAGGLKRPPNLALRATLQASDAKSARLLAELYERASKQIVALVRSEEERWLVTRAAELLQPRVEGEVLRLALDRDQVHVLATELLLPSLMRARQQAKQVVSMTNLRGLVTAMHYYVSDHQDQFPPDFDVLLSEGMISPKALQSPLRPELEVAYVYVNPGVKLSEIKRPSETIVMYEKFDEWPEGGVAAAFLDGHVERITDRSSFEEQLANNPGAQRE